MDNRLRHLSALRYFEAAARLSSYSRAAEELFISQAAVSQKIRQLEEALDCKLFVRKGRDMQLTDKGKTLFKQVSKGFEEVITGLNQISNEPMDGLLTVQAPPSFASRWLLPKLWKFSVKYPNIPIRVETTCDSPRLKHGEVDLIIYQSDVYFNTKSIVEPGAIVTPLLSEPIYPYCSPELAESMKFADDPSRLLDCWLIHYPHHAFPWTLWFEQSGTVCPEQTVQWMEVQTFDMALSTVVAGHGVCLASDILASEYTERGLLVKPFDIGLSPGLDFYVMVDPNSPRRDRIKVFSDWLYQEMQEFTVQRSCADVIKIA